MPVKKKAVKSSTPDWKERIKRFLSAPQLRLWINRHLPTVKKFLNPLGALAVGAPPYLVSQYYQTDKFSHDFKASWPVISAILDHHVIVGTLIAGLWVYLILLSYRGLMSLMKETPSGWKEVSDTILVIMDNIVGSKEQRFSKEFKRIKGAQNVEASDVFRNITQPEKQINELVFGIYSAFDVLVRGTEKYILKVNIATILDEKVCDINFHYPNNHPVRSDPEDLNQKDSAITNAIKSKQPVIIDSILEESRKPKKRFAVTDPSRADEDGSLICYPVVYDPTKQVIFVVSIHVDQPYVFKTRFKSSYETVMKAFVLRIKLEYSLMALKEATDGKVT